MSALRADAERNRDALVAAAHDVFSEQGLSAPLNEIARRAGVGNATLYRHFPDRAGLVGAVFLEQMERYVTAGDEALADPDPWSGFAEFLTRLCELQASDAGLSDLLTTTLFDGGAELARLRGEALARLERLIARAQRAGELRRDFRHQDVVMILMANAGLARRTAGTAPDASRRHLGLVLAGLRAPPTGPQLPAVSLAEMEAAMRALAPGDRAC